MIPKSAQPALASIVISSYNYAEYLPLTIQSALDQTYQPLEIIVVDDGSRDRSPDIMREFGNAIRPIFKPNGGQASAWNAGFAASKGDVVFFVDSDDLLTPTVVEKAMLAMQDPDVVKVQWPAWEINGQGVVLNEPGARIFTEGDLKDQVLANGPYAYVWPPSSQNAWRRTFLSQVMPMPEKTYVICPDLFLAGHAPIFGHVKTLKEPLSSWRVHAHNSSWRESFETRVQKGLERDNACADSMAAHCSRLGYQIDRKKWDSNLWWNQIFHALEDIDRCMAPGAPFILDDGDEWGCGDILRGRRRHPFIEIDGIFWGAPKTDPEAIDELERQRSAGVLHIAFVWPHLWRIDYLTGFKQHLDSHYKLLLTTDRSIIYDLRNG